MPDIKEGKESALRLLARRDYGACELKNRLLRKGYEQDVAEQIIHELTELGLQSDERFADCYIRRRMAKGFGPLHIASELSRLKINSDLIQELMIEHKEEWQEIIKKLCLKKFRITQLPNDLKLRAKLIRFFQSRGFDFQQVIMVLS